MSDDRETKQVVKRLNAFSQGKMSVAAQRRRDADTLERLAKALAHFVTDDMARKSIEVQMGKTDAKEWAAVRAASRLHGYNTLEEAENHFLALFGFEVKS